MEFEWDTAKAALNERKHAIPFSLAAGVFLDPRRLEWLDTRHDYGEPRWVTMGLVDDLEITVAYTLRGSKIRLISARRATHHERQDYWNS